MYIEGIELAELNSLRDGLLQAIWVRTRQARIFETLVNVMANGLSINPDIAKRIDELTSEYVDIVVPGTKKTKADNDLAFAERTNKTLSAVAKLLAGGGSGKIDESLLLK